MARDIHVVETGEDWEVWRLSDSMPLGKFPTHGEAVEMGEAQAAQDGVAFHPHGLPQDLSHDPETVV
jgi:hypothetical protein